MSYEGQKHLIKTYQNRVSDLAENLKVYKKKSFQFSITRLAIILFAIPLIYFCTKLGILAIIIGIIAVITSFILAVIKQQRFDNLVEETETLVSLNENEIDAIENFENLYYDGVKFKEGHHFYTDDLDIFGHKSLFALINRASTYDGVDQLSNFFLELPTEIDLKLRQEAVKELSEKIDWRQKFASTLFNIKIGHDRNLGKEIDEELNIDLGFASSSGIKFLIKTAPFLWILVIASYFLSVDLGNILASCFFIFNLLVTFRRASETSSVQAHLSQAAGMLRNYSNAISHLFSMDWRSSIIKSEIEHLKGSENSNNKVKIISELSQIIDHLDYRLNLIPAIILNGLVLWDYRVLSRLAEWKTKNNGELIKLFRFVGLMEGLSSLANWSYNNPQYTFPNINNDYFELNAIGAMHPLIPSNENVGNDFQIEKNKYLSIITGSNMSGKSTLLRTIGINMILGYAGTKVAADKFEMSLVKVISYMRIKDILEESVSTFKAELNRIRMILDLLQKGEKCFILIDEMLRGTNSKDKLAGSIGIVKRLISEQTYAMIATHDIKLAELGSEFKEEIANYYFDIDYADGDLVFDYKVKSGICENFNASFLLKQLGIEMSD